MGAPKIMIIDNKSLSAEELRGRLQDMGYRVTKVVSSEEEAVERVERDHPHLAMMDVKLPGGGDCIELARLLQDHFRVGVIFITSHPDDNAMQRAASICPLNYLIEPVSDAALRAAVNFGLTRHLRDTEIQETAEVLTATLDVLGGGTIVTDKNGFILSMSSVAETLTGWRESDAVDKHLPEVYVLRDEVTGEIVEDPISILHLKSEFVPLSTRYTLISKNQIPIPVSTALVGLNNSEGELLKIIVAFQDSSQMVMPEKFWSSYAANLHLSGLLLCKQGRYTRAEFCFKRALVIWERSLGSSSPRLSRALEGLADVYQRTDRHEEAQQLQARAAALRAGVPLES